MLFRSMDSVLKVMVGAKPTKYTYSELKKIPVKLHTKADQIAVLYASGAIDGGSNDGINSDDICKELEKLANNKKVKAVGVTTVWAVINYVTATNHSTCNSALFKLSTIHRHIWLIAS